MDGAVAGPVAGRDFAPLVRANGGAMEMDFHVEGMHCGGCVARIEKALGDAAGIRQARANLTTRQLRLVWEGPAAAVNGFARRVEALGFDLSPVAASGTDPGRREERELLVSMAVAGFAAANVMLLSVSLWSGHDGEMSAATRDLLHWFSALVALPAIAFAGRPFFRSAFSALRLGQLNMDVPISLAVVLAGGFSLFETVQGGAHVWFDSAVTLLFFLLLGRYLDRRARGRARSAAERFLALQDIAVTVLQDGRTQVVRPDAVRPGDIVVVAPGERFPVDGDVVTGVSEVDRSLLTGEAAAERVAIGDPVNAGTVNLSAAVHVTATATGEQTVLAEIRRLLADAESRRGRFVAIADRVARLYAPAVHVLAAATFAGWYLMGASVADALLYAIAVLIITCPCAMGLAVPAVQVVASGRLMRRGILVKTGDFLERLNQVDTVVFDKTGTLTYGWPDLLNADRIPADAMAMAAGMAASSRHPLSHSLARLLPDAAPVEGVTEVPGCGLVARHPDGEVRLGRPGWAGETNDDGSAATLLVLARPGETDIVFEFGDRLREDATETVAALKRQGMRVVLLSGDRAQVVDAVADDLGIDERYAAQSPVEKTAFLENLRARGHRPLMVGDGLNDAPALGAAHASLSPTSAADISQTAADAVFQGARLDAVTRTMDVAERANRLIRQNIGLSLAYNAMTVPLAVAGVITPLVAAICMSASSLVVVGNALRLSRGN